MSNQKVAVITGSNRLDGIGFACVEQLLKQQEEDIKVYLSGRDEGSLKIAEKALQDKGYKNLSYIVLDVSSKESITKFIKYFEQNGGIDYFLANANAGAVAPGKDKENIQGLEHFFEVGNFKGAYLMEQVLTKIIKPNGKFVQISSSFGQTKNVPDETIRKRLENDEITIEQLNEIIKEYILDIKNLSNEEIAKKWPNWSNFIGKICQVCLARIWNKKVTTDQAYIKERPGVTVYSACPGWVWTSLTREILEHNEELQKIAKQPADASQDIVWIFLKKNTEMQGELVQYRKVVQYK